jgi:hypothetical protein
MYPKGERAIQASGPLLPGPRRRCTYYRMIEVRRCFRINSSRSRRDSHHFRPIRRSHHAAHPSISDRDCCFECAESLQSLSLPYMVTNAEAGRRKAQSTRDNARNQREADRRFDRIFAKTWGDFCSAQAPLPISQTQTEEQASPVCLGIRHARH